MTVEIDSARRDLFYNDEVQAGLARAITRCGLRILGEAETDNPLEQPLVELRSRDQVEALARMLKKHSMCEADLDPAVREEILKYSRDLEVTQTSSLFAVTSSNGQYAITRVFPNLRLPAEVVPAQASSGQAGQGAHPAA